jgi:hypothetical protein
MCFLLTLLSADSERPTENLAARTERERRLAGGGWGRALGRVTVTGTVRKQFLFFRKSKQFLFFQNLTAPKPVAYQPQLD